MGYKQDLPLTWWGFWTAAGIPEDVRKILVPAVEKAVKGTRAKVDQLGNITEYRTPAEMKKLREEEYRKIYDMAVKIGFRETPRMWRHTDSEKVERDTHPMLITRRRNTR